MSGDETCPSCGGSGGGPFGRPGSAWDVETYVCPRCHGVGVLRAGASEAARLAKTAPDAAAAARQKPGIAGTRPAAPSPAKRRSSSGA
jgi:hypothetical protein